MITWRAYQKGDLAIIGLQEPEPFEGWLEHVEEHGRGMATITLGEAPLAVIGCTMCWNGVADCVMVLDRSRAKSHGWTIARMCRARLRQAMQYLGIHRMQATAAAHDRAGQVFLRAVGFKRESIMRQGAPDRTDLIIHAIIGAPTA